MTLAYPQYYEQQAEKKVNAIRESTMSPLNNNKERGEIYLMSDEPTFVAEIEDMVCGKTHIKDEGNGAKCRIIMRYLTTFPVTCSILLVSQIESSWRKVQKLKRMNSYTYTFLLSHNDY